MNSLRCWGDIEKTYRIHVHIYYTCTQITRGTHIYYTYMLSKEGEYERVGGIEWVGGWLVS